MALWLNLLWLTSRFFPLHRHLTIHTNILLIITLPGHKSVTLASTCQCGILGMSPSLVAESCSWIKTVELVVSSFNFHRVTMLENLKKACSSSICRSLERFQLKILKSRFGCGLKESSVNKCVRRCISDWLKKTTNNTNPCKLPGIWGAPQFIQK